MQVLDISYTSGDGLSNLEAYPFTLDGVGCGSMEGFLQGIKRSDRAAQERVLPLSGYRARASSTGRRASTLHWLGVAIGRDSEEYQILLDSAYEALYRQSGDFRRALRRSAGMALAHTMGSSDPSRTVLTEQEFLYRLNTLRDRELQMSYEGSRGELESPVGPLIGLRRPRYDVLNQNLGQFISNNVPDGGELFMFINLGHALRQFFTEFTAKKLTQGETRQYPKVLAAELVNLAGHYRHYAWSRFGVRTTIALYHSTQKCQPRLRACPEYKGSYYSKRVDPAPPEYHLIRRYADMNVEIARQFIRRLPNMYLVDTGELDPEAWPWAMMQAGLVTGPAVVMSGWDSDVQYCLAEDMVPSMSGKAVALLRAQGQHTRLVTRGRVIEHMLRDSKMLDELSAGLSPGHAPYLIALSGERDLGVEGIPKVGAAKAAKMIQDAVKAGRLPPDTPSLTSLLEELRIEGQVQDVTASWGCLVHSDYVREHARPSVMSKIDAQLEDLSGLGQIERVNSEVFGETPISLEMALAGEEW